MKGSTPRSLAKAWVICSRAFWASWARAEAAHPHALHGGSAPGEGVLEAHRAEGRQFRAQALDVFRTGEGGHLDGVGIRAVQAQVDGGGPAGGVHAAELHLGHAGVGEAQVLGGLPAEVEDAPLGEGPAVVDLHHDLAAIGLVLDLQVGSEGEGTVGAGVGGGIEDLPAGGGLPGEAVTVAAVPAAFALFAEGVGVGGQVAAPGPQPGRGDRRAGAVDRKEEGQQGRQGQHQGAEPPHEAAPPHLHGQEGPELDPNRRQGDLIGAGPIPGLGGEEHQGHPSRGLPAPIRSPWRRFGSSSGPSCP